MRKYVVRKTVTKTYDYEVSADSDVTARAFVALENRGVLLRENTPVVAYSTLTPDNEPEI